MRLIRRLLARFRQRRYRADLEADYIEWYERVWKSQ